MEEIKTTSKKTSLFSYLLTFLCFLLPLFFLPLTTDFYYFNKFILLSFFTVILLIYWVIKNLIKGKIIIVKNKSYFPLLCFLLVLFLSSLLNSNNKVLTLSSEPTLFLNLAIIYFLIVNCVSEKDFAKIIVAFLSSAWFLSWLAIFAYLGFFNKSKILWLKNEFWTPSGSLLNTAIFLLTLFPGLLFWFLKSKRSLKKILLFLINFSFFSALILIGSLFVYKKINFYYLPLNFGWQICLEGLKKFSNALFGVGPGNFLETFNLYKPLSYNNTPLWNYKFITNSNQFFQLLSTTGILGLFFYLYLYFQSFKKGFEQKEFFKKFIFLNLITSFILQFIFNANIILLYVSFVFMALLNTKKIISENDFWQIKKQKEFFGINGLIFFGALFFLYLESRLWLADYYFWQSKKTASQNKGVETYNLLIKSLKLNPYNEQYRLNFANTNLALAASLAQKEVLSDQEKNTIGQLIKQGIREAKIVISLSPRQSAYWLNLANLYRNLVNLSPQAKEWTLASYLQAIKYDPFNPLLRIDLGGLHYHFKNYEEAINQFDLAVKLKPDYANAWYNLGLAYKAMENYAKAYQSFQQTLILLSLDNPDRNKAETELREIEPLLNQKPALTQSKSSSLPNQKLEEPAPPPRKPKSFAEEKIDLEKELEPKITPETTETKENKIENKK